jgi:hypothetical protein
LAVFDALITQTNAATVAAYTSVSTAEQGYDYAEWWKRQEVNHALPNLFTGICTRSGNTLNFGSLNVVIDATASAVLSFNTGTQTATLKSSTLSANIITTGVVTLVNGAKVTGAIEDANGVRVVVRKSGGGTFNIAARRGTTGAYTDLGYQAGVTPWAT